MNIDEENTGTQPEVTTAVEKNPDEYHPPEPAKPVAAVVEEAPAVGETEEETKPAPKKAVDPLQKRIDELTRKRHEAERERDELRAKLASKTPAEEAQSETVDLEILAERKAAEILAQREYTKRVNDWATAGNKEFGKEEFTEKSNALAGLGAVERPEFMQIITDPDLISDGHRVVAALADDPEEAMRILSLSPLKMSAALVKYAEKVGKPKEKPVSKAPDPLKPIGGTAKATDEPTDNDSEAEWYRKRQAQRAGKTTGARF